MLNHLDQDPGPHLIISPASLLENWARELKKWCPHFSVVAYHGSERSALFRELTHFAKSGKPAPFNVMLTGYSLFERQRYIYCSIELQICLEYKVWCKF